MDSDNLVHSARSLESAFFAKEDARLLQQMRERAQTLERRAAMREVVRVNDEGLIDHLIALGLEPETVLALATRAARGHCLGRRPDGAARAGCGAEGRRCPGRGARQRCRADARQAGWRNSPAPSSWTRGSVTCARSGRCSRRRSGPISARRRSIARAASRKRPAASSASPPRFPRRSRRW